MKNMITLEWEIEHWLSGKDKDSITSLHAINKMVMSMLFKTLTIQKILKEFGHTFIIHIVLKKRKQSHILNLVKMMLKKLNIQSHIQQPNMLDSL